MTRSCQRTGCMNVLDGMRRDARYCSNACKTAAYKARTGYTLQALRKGRQTRKNSQSGLQVSYRKAVEKIAHELREHGVVDPPDKARIVAELWMRDALPARQRERA